MAGGLSTLGLLGSRGWAPESWPTGVDAPWHVGSSRTREGPVPPALAGRFFITEPPGKLLPIFFFGGVAIYNISGIR